MDEFPGLLAKDFGFRPQGKSAPMAASKGTNSINSGGNLNVGIRSGGDSRSASFSSNRSKSGWNSNSVGGSFIDDHDGLFGSTATQKTQDYGGFGGYDDVFGGPPKFDNRKETRGGGAPSASSFDYDSIFQGSKDSSAKLSSLPVFDKPKYDDDDDIFRGLPGMKGSSAAATANNDDVFASISSPPKQSAAFDDLLGNFNRKEPDSKSSSGRRSEEVVKDASGFDDLLPGFGGSSPKNRATSKTNQPQQSTVPSTKSTASVMDDPFVVLESTSTPVYQPSGLFTDPLEQMSKASNSRSSKFDGSLHSGKVLDDMDPLDSLGKSVPMFSPDMNDRLREKSPLRTGSMEGFPGKESNEKSSVRASEHTSQKKVPVDNYRESHQTLFDIPSVSSDSNKPPGHAGSRRSFVNASYNETSSQADMSPKSENIMEGADDIWLTVSEVPLFTQPTSAPPPSRPPPPRPAQVSRGDKSSFAPVNTKKVNEFPTFPHSTQNFQSSRTVPASVNNSGVSSIDELEDFATGRCRSNADESADILSSEEDIETNSAAAAMKEAMDRAEAKFKHAKEVRERETARSGRSREVAHDAQERELREKQEKLDREREQKEREDKEREQRRLERERERAREIEMEKARQAVERATREARERAAAEVRLKAERAQAEARERAAVQRVQAEARERAGKAAIEARERAAAEARERAASEAREKEARERAAVSRAEAEVRLRAERAAVERAAAEARERAAAEARERAAAAATASQNQQKNDNDLESFFSNMGGRPSSVPRPRPNTDPFETQFQNKGGSDGPRRTSSGTSPSMKKASSTTNIVDDLSSIFGGTSSPSGEFQEIKGETEERRKARLERHQRTNERAAKALAEKNQRDLQTQQDQAERHRIAETLDIEIKRWAAGKETNLRALLSTLQYVLWPECGWQPVSLTDLITAASVKKVYRKATLCIHPDKVQQKGANIQQKYIAEKVFDLLKESWNKFNSEELF